MDEPREFERKKKKGVDQASRWSESKISSVYGDPKKLKERRSDDEAHLMTKTTRRSCSR